MRLLAVSNAPKPTITTWTCALPRASLSHANVRCAKWILIFRANNSCQRIPTCSPCEMEFVETNPTEILVPRLTALLLQNGTGQVPRGLDLSLPLLESTVAVRSHELPRFEHNGIDRKSVV